MGVAAQDVFWEPKGAFTGEVSVAMLEDLCSHVIIGHSERRQFFGETDATVQKKLAAVLASRLDPIVCVGELLAERQGGRTEDVLRRQIQAGLADVQLGPRITIAYEPVWAIGTGETATPEIAQAACAFIRGELRALNPVAAGAIRIQYGGSVTRRERRRVAAPAGHRWRACRRGFIEGRPIPRDRLGGRRRGCVCCVGWSRS